MAKEAAAARTKVRRREKKNITSGVAHVNASFNNTMVTITDAQGNTIAWSSSGTKGFKGTYKIDRWCQCPNAVSATRAPETAVDFRFPRLRQDQVGIQQIFL